MTPSDVGFAVSAVGAMLASFSMARLPLLIERRKTAELAVRLTEVERQLLIGGEYAGKLSRERTQARQEVAMLREVLSHCTCASSPSPDEMEDEDTHRGPPPDAEYIAHKIFPNLYKDKLK